MTPESLSPVANHLWQSTLFAVAAGLLILALPRNPARVRNRIWVAASLKFLVPFSALITLGSQVQWHTVAFPRQTNFSIALDQVSQPFMTPVSSPPAWVKARPAPIPISAILWAVWACGFIGVACSFWLRWLRIQAAVRAGSPVQLDISIKAISSPALMQPGIFGVFRPVLLLPEGVFQRLTPTQLKAVIAHELCHVRQRDNLVSLIHLFVEAIFWFHPLVWWIGKRILQERERACDEEVLRLGSEPREYAQGILKICELYLESSTVLVAGVSGSNLRKRIEGIMNKRIVMKLTGGKKALLAVAGVLAVVGPVALGVMNAPLILAQPSDSRPSDARPSDAHPGHTQPSNAQPSAKPQFEVASVRPCDPHTVTATLAGRTSPGLVVRNCQTLWSYIHDAYGIWGNSSDAPAVGFVNIEGGPAWIKRDLFAITAKAEGPTRPGTMSGPMMQALLEDRFKLKIHEETRVVPVYALVVAKAGLRLPAAKIDCWDWSLPFAGRREGQPPADRCGRGQYTRDGVGVHGSTIADFCVALTSMPLPLGMERRKFVDKTGITGRFDFDLKFPAELTAGEGAPWLTGDFVGLQDALSKVGLELKSEKGQDDFIVIDHAEPPTPN
jgi:bla regulator protein BlaR1